jgi:hypothetical protein
MDQTEAGAAGGGVWPLSPPGQGPLAAIRSKGKKWLSDLDSNQDELLQRELCYRYTIGQAEEK